MADKLSNKKTNLESLSVFYFKFKILKLIVTVYGLHTNMF